MPIAVLIFPIAVVAVPFVLMSPPFTASPVLSTTAALKLTVTVALAPPPMYTLRLEARPPPVLRPMFVAWRSISPSSV